MSDKTITGADHCALCGKELSLDETQMAYVKLDIVFCKACGMTKAAKDLIGNTDERNVDQ